MTKTETLNIGILLILTGAIGVILLKKHWSVESYGSKQAAKDFFHACVSIVTLQYNPSRGASYYVVPMSFIVLGLGFLISTRF